MKAKLQDALDKITIPMLNALDYGEELELNDTYSLNHYLEDDKVSLVETEEWNEVLDIMWDEFNIEYDVIEPDLID